MSLGFLCPLKQTWVCLASCIGSSHGTWFPRGLVSGISVAVEVCSGSCLHSGLVCRMSSSSGCAGVCFVELALGSLVLNGSVHLYSDCVVAGLDAAELVSSFRPGSPRCTGWVGTAVSRLLVTCCPVSSLVDCVGLTSMSTVRSTGHVKLFSRVVWVLVLGAGRCSDRCDCRPNPLCLSSCSVCLTVMMKSLVDVVYGRANR